jgi:hypothetical protein
MSKCPLYRLCKSPSKSLKWACKGDDETRRKSCVVYVAFFNQGPIKDVIIVGEEA